MYLQIINAEQQLSPTGLRQTAKFRRDIAVMSDGKIQGLNSVEVLAEMATMNVVAVVDSFFRQLYISW
jgi:hypothetical protein